MKLKCQWHPVSMWTLTLSLQRGAVQWWQDPIRNRAVLKSRAGHIYDFTYVKRLGWLIRRRAGVNIN